jgi:rRNA maturation RNase YbeY
VSRSRKSTTARHRLPEVTVIRRARAPGIRLADIRRDARRILVAMDEADTELAISLVGDVEIHDLNRRYRRKDRPTDVLAFAMREGETGPDQSDLLGDVVISLETAVRQAKQRRRQLAAEVRVLLVHGVLHLLGYDHEKSAAEARRMRSTERRLLGLLGR